MDSGVGANAKARADVHCVDFQFRFHRSNQIDIIDCLGRLRGFQFRVQALACLIGEEQPEDWTLNISLWILIVQIFIMTGWWLPL